MVVKGWSTFQSVNWAADGKGLFVASLGEAGSVLFRTDLRGNAHSLWEQQANNTPWTNIVQPLGNHPSLGECPLQTVITLQSITGPSVATCG